MNINQLFKNIPDCQLHGSPDTTITGMSGNSKEIAPGFLFIAKKGRTFDGSQFIADAIQNGASAILTHQFNPSSSIPQIIHSNPGAIEALLAATFYQRPSDQLFLVGITGTSGKSTTSFITKHLFDHFKGPCGLIGGIDIITGKNRYEPTHTTPDVVTNQKILREMVDHQCRSCVMEVTSHALMQGRVNEIDYDVAVFTNLTPEHLDYHPNMDDYCRAKNRLFKSHPKWAIVNADDPWSPKIIDGYLGPVLTYGIDHAADLKASNIRLGEHGTHVKISFQGQTIEFEWPLVGRFNVYNCLAAIGVALTQGIALSEMVGLMVQLPAVQGRLEPVANALGLKIYVDHSHKADALANVLATLQEFKNGRIITVFGCGGDRDHEKRPKMAKIAEDYSDFTIVTNDNPRSEDPELISHAIVQGFTRTDTYRVELDRQRAIRLAIEMAAPSDLILIAGKGHETYQIFDSKTVEFDDRKVASDVCSEIALKRK